VDRARRLGRAMAADTPRKRELLEELAHAVDILTFSG
jgi:hypothetical protein